MQINTQKGVRMIERLLQLILIKNKDGEFTRDAKRISDARGKSLNAVYASRQGDCRHDIMVAFDEIVELVKAGAEGGIALTGSKTKIAVALEDMLKSEKLYEITVKEI